MIIGLDFDGTINNMLDTWVECLNKKYETRVKVSDITNWELAKVFPTLSKSELFEPLNTPEFWRSVTIKPDAVEVVLRQHRSDACSASAFGCHPRRMSMG